MKLYKKEVIIMKMRSILGFLILALLLSACATTISQKKVVPLIPYADKRFAPGEEGKSISLTEGGVTITVQFLEGDALTSLAAAVRPPNRLDFAPLLSGEYINYADEGVEDMVIAYNIYSRTPAAMLFNELGKSPFYYGWRVSPYFDEDMNPVFTAFSVTVENKRSDKIGLDPSIAIVIDDAGHQFNAYTYDEAVWEAVYPKTVSGRLSPLRGRLYPPPYPYQTPLYYGGGNYLIKSRILSATLLRDKRVYPGAKVKGVLVFPKIEPKVRKFRLIIPEVTYFDGNKVVKKLDFEFDFWIEEQGK